ncbi:helix-turn-helix transcriptional regulator [Micromonospora sp. WMMD1102]|uniref:helix-turn-helix domain-containing protein n=1 Tax=Micromonospora sp. WMMD1102 TaxID=3016105 RepID=UPI002415967D|nr:helix-turn-helix transcriptional regulator [Micromonospora sp. WMMD1102]MDG4790102.1 helix-turn-helix transcriptional regulator [Micromonospora sp. WMMD1102]
MDDQPASLPARIRELRTQRKLSQDRLAAAIGVAKSTVQSFESGKLIPQEGTAQRLDGAFGTGQELQELAKNAHDDLRPWLRSWEDHERRALTLRAYQPLLIPGLLQCESYMRAVFAGSPGNAGRVDELTAGRLARQGATIGREHPAILSAIIGEVALRTGPPEVLKEQLNHLVDVGHLPHVKVRVVAQGAGGLHVGLGGAFVLAGLPEGRRVGYMDDQLTGRVATSHVELARLDVAWLEVDALAMSADQSRDVILRMIDGQK